MAQNRLICVLYSVLQSTKVQKFALFILPESETVPTATLVTLLAGWD